MADDTKLRTPPVSATASAGYASDGSASAGGDPLAELARLIGQDDVFEQMRRDASRGTQSALPPASDPVPPRASRNHAAALGASLGLRGSDEPNEPAPLPPVPPRRTRLDDSFQDAPPAYAPAPRATATREPPRRSSAPPPAPVEEPSYRQGPAPAYAAPSHDQPPQGDPAYNDPAYDPGYDYYDDQAYDDQPPLERPRRRGVYALAAVLGLAVIGTAGAFGYRAYTSGDGQPPVIKAAGTPAKVAPATTARDQGRTTYDRTGSAQPERVVPREEQPVELREPRSVAPRAPSATSGMIGMTGQAPAALSPQPQAQAGNSHEPKRVKTIPIRADGTVGQEPAAAPRAATGGAARVQQTAQPAAPVRTASIPQTQAPPGTHWVQVSSQMTEDQARRSFQELQAKYPAVLGNRQSTIRKTDLGDRGVRYRVQIGGFASADAAIELCNSLKSAGGQCLVGRN